MSFSYQDFLRWEETDYDAINVKRIYIDIAEDVVFNQQKRIRKEFIIASDSCYYRMMTGQALWEYLFDLYVKELRQKKDEQNTEANNG